MRAEQSRRRVPAARGRLRLPRLARARLVPVAFAIAAVSAGLVACGNDDGGGNGEAGGNDAPSPVVVTDENGFSPQQIYADSASGVVTVEAVFGGGGGILGGVQAGQGSGFVLNDKGEIATNAHVVAEGGQGNGGGTLREAEEVFVEFSDRNKVEAEVIGFDPFADVALIKIDPDGLDLNPVELGSSDSVEVGQPVAAIGSPFGEDQSLSVGVVSATDRSIPSLTQFAIDGAIQTDASINPGNSGGPLMDLGGKVVGINQQINTTSGGNEGVGFAVPIDLAKRSIDQLREEGETSYAFIGVTSQPLYPQLAERLEIGVSTGALIAEVTPNGPADDAGLRGGDEDDPIEFQGQEIVVGGDVIVSVDGERLRTPSDLARLISLRRPGDKVEVEIIRGGDRRTIEVELEARPDRG